MRLPYGVQRTFRLLVPGSYRHEVDEELRFHIESRTDALIEEGMDPREARREALRRFGDPERIRAECRSLARSREASRRRAGLRDELLQDARWALRRLRRDPAFALAVVAILALGIGAATALFGVADAVVFRPLPFPEPERLVRVWELTPQGDRFSVSLPNLLDWRRESRAFSGMAAYELRNASLEIGDEPHRVLATPVTEDFFELLGLRPAAGGLLPEEAYTPGGDSGWIVLSHELWQRAFGGDPAVVGSTVRIDRRPAVIAGVLGPEAGFPAGAELWTGLPPEQRWERDDKNFQAVARLAPGVAPDRAEAGLRRLAASLSTSHPEANQGWSAEVEQLRDAVLGPGLERAFLVLLGAVGLLLVIACVNVSSLLVARGAAQGREMAVRISLGAPRIRLVRQLLVESLALGLLGGAFGLGLAASVLEAVRRFGPEEVPRLGEAAVDARVLAFSVAAAVASSLLAGLFPALQGSTRQPGADLRSGGRTVAGAGVRLRRALVVAQLALAVTLLVGAGLLARSYSRLLQVDPGFDAGDVLAVRVDLPEAAYSADARVALAEEVRRRLETLPGVAAAAGSVGAPLAGFRTANEIAVPGREPGPDGGYPVAQWRSVTPAYFQALDVPLLQGRTFTVDDRTGGGAVIVSRSLAERLWPGENPLERELFFGGPDGSPRVVVGVVGDIRDVSLADAPLPTLFLPYAQVPWVHLTWMVEARARAGTRAALAESVRRELRRLVPDVPVPEVRPLAENLGRARTHPRFQAFLMAAFALTAVALAASGIYGLMAFTVAQRHREIGVRLALGARPGAVVSMITRQGAALVAAGLALGTAGALLAARTLESLLYRTPPAEFAAYALAAAALAVTGLMAAWLPARRAAAVDPTVALSSE